MIIESIHLKNFRQYRDFKIELSPNSGVTVIRANNSIGKTTLMQSIKWALFGTKAIELDNKEELANYILVKECKNELISEADYSVELVIIHENRKYNLKRTETIDVVSKRISNEIIELTYLDNGETKILRNTDQDRVNLINKTIESWISEKMINYFFLDGERIEKLSQFDKRSQEEISEAITSVSKLPIINNSLDTIKEVKREVRRQEAKSTRDSEVSALNREIEELKYKRFKLEEDKKVHSITDKELKEEIDVTNENLINRKQVTNLQNDRNRLDKELKDIQETMNKIRIEIGTLYKEYQHKKLVQMLFKKYDLDKLRGNEMHNTVPNMEVEAINHIIKNGTCICGTKLEEQHIYKLEEQKSYQPPVSNEGLITTYEHSVELETFELDQKVNIIKQKMNEYYENEKKLFSVKDRLRDIHDKINEFDEDEIKELNHKLNDLETQSASNKEKLAAISVELKSLNSTIDNKQVRYRKKMENLKQSEFIKVKLELIREVYTQIEGINEREKERQRIQIEKYANIHFKHIISKDKKVIIDKEYKHIVKDSYGNETSLSSGESIALSVSIILAIIDTHKKNLESNNKEEILTKKDFFLVLDGAFAVLDKNFSKAIAEKITDRLDQVIILTNDNQYTDSVKEAISSKLQKEYKLEVENKEDENELYSRNLIEVK